MNRSFLEVMVLAFLLTASGRAAETQQRTGDLGYARADRVDTDKSTHRLIYDYVQENGGPIWMEAERASVIRFTPGKGELGKDEQASGGFYLVHVDHMEFHVEVKDAGKYTAWYRAWFPWAGHWNHSENMDGGMTQANTDSTGEVLKQWIWVKGLTYDLAAGEHSWNFTPAGWCGGTRLDKVLLTKDEQFVPKDKGGTALPSRAPADGEVVTEEFARQNVVKWEQFRVENASGKGSVAVHYSDDQGKTWQTLPADGSLGSVAPDKELSFKMTLKPDESGMTPFITKATITYQVKAVPPIILENDTLSFLFSGENGALQAIRNKITRTDYVMDGVETPLFTFLGFRPETKTLVDIGFSQAELKQVVGPKQGKLELTYRLMGGAIQAVMKVGLAGPLARFSLTVDNKSIYDIAQVRVLPLRGLRIGVDCTDDYLCTPITTGSIVKYPAAYEFPRLIYTDRPLFYPGMATMCWMDLWDEKGGGLYMACEDQQYRLTEITFSNGAGEQPQAEAKGAPLPPGGENYKMAAKPGPYVNLGFDKRLLISKKTGPVQVPDVVLGVHQGDWHWGADRYREWAEPWMTKIKQTPDWFRDAEGYLGCHMIHLGSFVDLAKGRPRGDRQFTMREPPYPFIGMWAQMASCEAYWSTPVLHRLLGSPEEYRGGVQKQHELGHRYISYNLPSNINPLFNREGKRFGIVPRCMYPDDEVPPKGFYPEVGVRLYDGSLRTPDGIYCEATVCNAATKWQEYVRHIILDKYVKEYGNDGMYLDGAGLYDGATQDCKNLQHGHAGYGEWTLGFLKWLSEVKAETRKVRPGAVYMGEGMSDVYHMYLDCGLAYPDNSPQVYRYAMPWNDGMLQGGETMLGWPSGMMEFLTVYGLKYGAVECSFKGEPWKFYQVIAFREAFSQFQFRGRFMDDQGLRIEDPDIKAKLTVRNDSGVKGALVVAFNEKNKDGITVRVDRDRVGKLKTAWYYSMDSVLHSLPVKEEKRTYVFTLPTSSLSAIMLLEKCEPFIRFHRVSPVVPGESGRAAATLTNLEKDPVDGIVTLKLPANWTTVCQPFRLASGQSVTYELAFDVPKGTPYDVYDIYAVTRESKRETGKCQPMGVCHAIQAEIYYMNHGTIKVSIENVSRKEISGTCHVVTPDKVKTDKQDVPFTAAAGSREELIFHLSGVDGVSQREHIKAVLRYGEEEANAYEQLQPPVLNGGFEQCLAGDGYPDYWNYRPEARFLQGVVLDTNVFSEGRQSLRIDPYDGQNHILTTFVKLVPNTRYKISLQVRRSGDADAAVHLWSMGSKDKTRTADVWLGNVKGSPSNTWEKIEKEFVSADFETTYNLLLCGHKTAAIWYDDIRIVPIP